MGHLEHLDRPGVDRHRLGLGVSGEEHAEAPPASEEDQRRLVEVVRRRPFQQRPRRPQHLDPQAPRIDLRPLGDRHRPDAGGAGIPDQVPAALPVEQPVDRERAEQLRDPAGVVGLVVGDDRGREARDSLVLELAAQVSARWAAVDQHRLAVGRVEQDRIALADVEHDDAQPGRGLGGRPARPAAGRRARGSRPRGRSPGRGSWGGPAAFSSARPAARPAEQRPREPGRVRRTRPAPRLGRRARRSPSPIRASRASGRPGRRRRRAGPRGRSAAAPGARAAGRRARPASPATSAAPPRAARAGSRAERRARPPRSRAPSAGPWRASRRSSPRRPRRGPRRQPATRSPIAAGWPEGPRRRSRIGPAQSRIPITAAKLSCQPASPLARGLIARVTKAASRIAYQRERGRPARAATTPPRP